MEKQPQRPEVDFDFEKDHSTGAVLKVGATTATGACAGFTIVVLGALQFAPLLGP